MPKSASQHDYEMRELRAAQQQLNEIRHAPLDERKEARAAFFEAMRDNPRLVGERVGWLLDGNYGYGSMLLAKQILHRPRMNRAAALTQMIGAFEWQCPEDMTRQAWKRLSGGEKHELARAVEKAIEDAEDAED